MAQKLNSKEQKPVSLRPVRYVPPHLRSNERENFIPSSSYWGEDHSHKQKQQQLPEQCGGFVKLSSLVGGKPPNKTEVVEVVSNLKTMNPDIFNSIDSIDTVGTCEEVQSFQWSEVGMENAEWRDTLTSMQEQFVYMLHHQVRTDCVCIVGAHQKQMFRCHKVMLSRASAELDVLVHASDEIEISDVEPNTFKYLLQYIYSGKIELESSNQALYVCDAAIKYNVTQLRNLCANFLCDNLAPDMFWCVLDMVLDIETPASLKHRCLKFLQTHTQLCLNSPKFVLISLTCLIWVLQQEDLNIESEMDLILASTCWAMKVTNTGFLYQEDPLTPNLRKALGPAFSHLRFLSLTPSQFSLGLADSNLLSEHEKFLILVDIITPGHIPIPDGICNNRNPRNHTKKSPREYSKLTTKFNICFRPRIKSPFVTGIESKKMISNLEFKCDKDINIIGVEVSTQHMKRNELPIETNNNDEVYVAYQEHIIVTLLKKGEVLNEVTYTLSAAYNAQLPILFNKMVRLTKDTVYTIHVQFKKPGSYVTYVRSTHVIANDVNFKFTHEEEVGLIEAIAFIN